MKITKISAHLMGIPGPGGHAPSRNWVFVRWVTEGTEPCLTWREGLRCVEVMEAAHRSAKQNGFPTTLPLYPELEES